MRCRTDFEALALSRYASIRNRSGRTDTTSASMAHYARLFPMQSGSRPPSKPRPSSITVFDNTTTPASIRCSTCVRPCQNLGLGKTTIVAQRPQIKKQITLNDRVPYMTTRKPPSMKRNAFSNHTSIISGAMSESK